jgi:hypothetical protein
LVEFSHNIWVTAKFSGQIINNIYPFWSCGWRIYWHGKFPSQIWVRSRTHLLHNLLIYIFLFYRIIFSYEKGAISTFFFRDFSKLFWVTTKFLRVENVNIAFKSDWVVPISSHWEHQSMFCYRTLTENCEKQDKFSIILWHITCIGNSNFFLPEHYKKHHI